MLAQVARALENVCVELFGEEKLSIDQYITVISYILLFIKYLVKGLSFRARLSRTALRIGWIIVIIIEYIYNAQEIRHAPSPKPRQFVNDEWEIGIETSSLPTNIHTTHLTPKITR